MNMNMNNISTLLVDTDAGFDDFLALAALQNTSREFTQQTPTFRRPLSINIPFLSTVGGMQESPLRAADFYQEMMNFGTLSGNGNGNKDDTKIVVGHSLNPNLQVPEWLTDYRTQLNNFTENESNCDGNYNSSSSTGKKGLAQFVSSRRSMVNSNARSNANANKDDDEVKNTVDLSNANVNKDDDEVKNTVDLMCLGPLTNVASWLEAQTQDDDVFSFIEEQVNTIWIMGGNLPAYDLGGGGAEGGGGADDSAAPAPEAEFNFAQDPKAAYAVLNGAPSSITDKIIIVPADTCRKEVPDEFMWQDFCMRAANSRSKPIDPLVNANANTNTMVKDTETFSNGSLMDLVKNMLPSSSTSMDENPNPNVNVVENGNADLNQNLVRSMSSGGSVSDNDAQLRSRRRRQYYIDLIAKVIENDDSFDELKFDPLCAFAYANPECIKIKKMTVRVDAQSGLVLHGNGNNKQMDGNSSSSSRIWKKSSKKNQSSGKEESGPGPASLRFVTDIQVDGKDGFIAWLNDALELNVDADGSGTGTDSGGEGKMDGAKSSWHYA